MSIPPSKPQTNPWYSRHNNSNTLANGSEPISSHTSKVKEDCMYEYKMRDAR
jgi:hypothetical protein